MPRVPALQSKTRWAGGITAALGLALALQTGLQSTQQSIDQAGLTFTWMPAFDHWAGLAVSAIGMAIMVIRALDEQLKKQ